MVGEEGDRERLERRRTAARMRSKRTAARPKVVAPRARILSTTPLTTWLARNTEAEHAVDRRRPGPRRAPRPRKPSHGLPGRAAPRRRPQKAPASIIASSSMLMTPAFSEMSSPSAANISGAARATAATRSSGRKSLASHARCPPAVSVPLSSARARRRAPLARAWRREIRAVDHPKPDEDVDDGEASVDAGRSRIETP